MTKAKVLCILNHKGDVGKTTTTINLGAAFSTHIRNAIALAEAPTQGQDIFHYAPKSARAEDYEKVCNELLTGDILKAHGS